MVHSAARLMTCSTRYNNCYEATCLLSDTPLLTICVQWPDQESSAFDCLQHYPSNEWPLLVWACEQVKQVIHGRADSMFQD